VNPASALVVITPATVLSVGLAGLFLAWFVWHVSRHVRPQAMFINWVAGTAFLALMFTGRYVDGADNPEKWLGAAILWTEYVVVSYLAVLAWRRVRPKEV
jgi:hypothetical protein